MEFYLMEKVAVQAFLLIQHVVVKVNMTQILFMYLVPKSALMGNFGIFRIFFVINFFFLLIICSNTAWLAHSHDSNSSIGCASTDSSNNGINAWSPQPNKR